MDDQDSIPMLEEVRALRADVAALRDHVSHIGHLVQTIEARGRRRVYVPVRLKVMAKRAYAPVRRIAGLVSRPRHLAVQITNIYREALLTSHRAHKTNAGWRQKIRWDLLIESISKQVERRLFNRRPPVYAIKQHKPTTPGVRPRILHAIPNVFVGGSTQLIVDIYDHLGHKYDMHVMTSAFPAGASHDGMIVHDFREPTTVDAMVSLMMKFRPSLIHIHYWGDVDTAWYAKVFDAAHVMNLPVVLNINTPVKPYADKSVAHCVYVSEYVRAQFGGIFAKETVIHPGIDLERFQAPEKREKHADQTIGMVYRLEPDKLNMESIEIFIEVVKLRPSTRVVIVGGGSFFDPFIERTRAAGVRQNFDFTGYVPYETLDSYYKLFSVFVAPVWKESFGQVTPFAMAMGLAVAGNQVGALPEILGSDATLGRSVRETAEKIVALLDDPEGTRRLGERNRDMCVTKYAVGVMCARYDDVYKEALGLPSDDPMPDFPPAELFLA